MLSGKKALYALPLLFLQPEEAQIVKEDCGSLEVVVAGGPNRYKTLEAALELSQQKKDTCREVNLVFRMDGPELPNLRGVIDDGDGNWTEALKVLDKGCPDPKKSCVSDQLQDLPPEVGVHAAIQPYGTSYTEVAYHLEGTNADEVMFVASTYILQWRLALAARNTLQATGKNQKVTVIYSGEQSTIGDNVKELGSWLMDESLFWAGGHDGVMEKSRGGNRWSRLKQFLLG